MKLLMIGGGGHFHSVVDCIEDKSIIVGVLDDLLEKGHYIDGIEVVGKLMDFQSVEATHYFICLGDINLRRKIIHAIKPLSLLPYTIQDPSAIVSETAIIQQGVFIGKQAIVNAHATVSAHAIINTKALVEHDSFVGENTHVSVNATLCGKVQIQEDCFIGASATILPSIHIGSNCIVGASCLVNKTIENDQKVVGVPCRVIHYA